MNKRYGKTGIESTKKKLQLSFSLATNATTAELRRAPGTSQLVQETCRTGYRQGDQDRRLVDP
jgi:hypothetical protein